MEPIIQHFMINPFDTAIAMFFSNLYAPAWFETFVLIWTDYSQQIFMLSAIVLMFFKKTRKIGIIGFVAMFLSPLMIEAILKPTFMRPRPYQTFEWVRLIGDETLTYSFPSGHSSMAWATATAFSFGQKRWVKICLFCAAAFTSFTRVFISIHWTTDVLAGVCTGVLAAWLAYWLINWIYKKLDARKAKKAAAKAANP